MLAGPMQCVGWRSGTGVGTKGAATLGVRSSVRMPGEGLMDGVAEPGGPDVAPGLGFARRSEDSLGPAHPTTPATSSTLRTRAIRRLLGAPPIVTETIPHRPASRPRATIRQPKLVAIDHGQFPRHVEGELFNGRSHLWQESPLVNQFTDAEHLRLQPAAYLVEQTLQRPIPGPLAPSPHLRPESGAGPPGTSRQCSETPSSVPFSDPSQSRPRYPGAPPKARDSQRPPSTRCSWYRRAPNSSRLPIRPQIVYTSRVSLAIHPPNARRPVPAPPAQTPPVPAPIRPAPAPCPLRPFPLPPSPFFPLLYVPEALDLPG